MASSGSLPGVWPATTVNGQKHFDGGCHSMENADLAKGAKSIDSINKPSYFYTLSIR